METLSKHIQEYAFSPHSPYRGLKFSPQDAKFHSFWLFEDGTTQNESGSFLSRECEPDRAMARWLETTNSTVTPVKPTIARTRTLFQEWRSSESACGPFDETRPLPNKYDKRDEVLLSRTGFALLSKYFNIDPYYSYAYLTRGYWVSPLRPSSVDGESGLMRAIFQSPRHSSHAFSMAVTHRPKLCMTEIYILCEDKRFQRLVLQNATAIGSIATHPLTLAVLFFQGWIERVDITNNAAHKPLNKVRNNVHEIGHLSMEKNTSQVIDMDSGEPVDSKTTLPSPLDDLRQTHIQTSEYEIGNMDVPFLEAFSSALEQSFDNLTVQQHHSNVHNGIELKRLFHQLQNYLQSVASRRVMLKEKVAFQQQTLYFNLQQRDAQTNLDISKAMQHDSETNIRIAQAMQRDSVAMRTIAALTMAFLPLTAVAAIFSMPFFSLASSTSSTSRITVTSDFYIYWVVVIPLTLVVFFGWRSFLYNRWHFKDIGSAFSA